MGIALNDIRLVNARYRGQGMRNGSAEIHSRNDLEAGLEQFREIAADPGADLPIEKDLHFVLIAPKRGLTKILRRRAS